MSQDVGVRRSGLARLALGEVASGGLRPVVLHGSLDGNSDVDFVVACDPSGSQTARAVAGLTGIRVVQQIRHEHGANYLVIASREDPVTFVALDGSCDYRRDRRIFLSRDYFMGAQSAGTGCPPPTVPSHADFACYLIKRVLKGEIGEVQASELSRLFQRDPEGCTTELKRFWPRAWQELLKAARDDEWAGIQRDTSALRAELLRHTRWRRATVRYWLQEIPRVFWRLRQPTGLFVVYLGPDGAGKTSVSAAAARAVAPAFRGLSHGHFAPGLLRNKSARPVLAPHGQRPRSAPMSLLKAAYWLADFSLGYATNIWPAKVRSHLVVYDRYLLDVLVDKRRYRYAGPDWLIKLVWRLSPKPDVVILLDAPAEVVHERKAELSMAELERQRAAYRELVASLPNGVVIDSNRPIDDVTADVAEVLLGYMEARTARRLGMPEKCTRSGESE